MLVRMPIKLSILQAFMPSGVQGSLIVAWSIHSLPYCMPFSISLSAYLPSTSIDTSCTPRSCIKSAYTSSGSLPLFLISVGLVVTPDITPASNLVSISLIIAESRNSFI